MPQPLFLHIRARGRGSTHVLELSSDSIRIGRGNLCEVRLDDPSLAEVECFLRRRAETWHVQPLSPKGRISIDGRPVTHLRAVAMSVPIRVGDATLVLRDTATVAPAFGAFDVPIAAGPPLVFGSGELREDDRLGDRLYVPSRSVLDRTAPAIPATQPSPFVEVTPPRPRQAARERSWESRWRAAGRTLKLRGQAGGALRHESRPLTAKLTEGPATVPFAPREARVEPVATDEADQAEPDGRGAVDVGLVAPEPTPEILLREATEVEPPGEPASVAPVHEPEPPNRRDQAAPRATREEEADRSSLAARRMPAFDEEWPSVRSILQAHQERCGEPSPRAAMKSRPTPTDARLPAHWSPPGWLVALPMAGAILVAGALGIFLGSTWGEDDRQAGLLADRILRANGAGKTVIGEEEVNPDGSWWRTTGGHLAIRAAALGSMRGESSREETTRFLLQSARAAAPLEAATRMARAELSAGDSPLAALGLSRDTVALALTARTLAREGKTQAALAAYRSALELVARSDVGRGRTPAFLDEPNAKRFALPFEALVSSVIGEMAAQPGWTYETWSGALPEHGLVLLAAYRVLSDRRASESEAVLNRLIESPAAPASGSQALHAVARAEGLAIKGRWEDASTLYAEAIAAMPDEVVRRTWHLNRGVILARNGAVDQATDAMALARAGRGDDEIGRKVSQTRSREGIGRAPATAARTSPAQTLHTN